jgi:hypothetical protein
MAEYDEVAGKLDATQDASATVREISAARKAQIEQDIADETRFILTNPAAEPRYDVQATTPEDFTERLNSQLRDPVYAAKAVLSTPQEMINSQLRHKKIVDSVLGSYKGNKRWQAATSSWFDGSPYEGDVQFHVDRFTDPTRPNSFIQFEEPWEFGIHSGTNDAAESVIHRGGIETAIKGFQEEDQAIQQMAEVLEEPVSTLEAVFGQAAENHFRQKFSSNLEINIWEEVEEILQDFSLEFDLAEGVETRFISQLKALPRPNTTPFLFRGKNGLLLHDDGGFKAWGVANQLERMFPEDSLAIDAALGELGETAKQKKLQAFMESKGYDHVVYHNSVEDKGSLSIINWNPDLMAAPWDVRFTRGPNDRAKVAAQFLVGALGFNATVRDKE